jgi:hypothetical protein
LLSELSGDLDGSTVNLSQGEYEQARALLGDEYNDSLEKYVDVAGDTDSERSARQLQRAQRVQQTYVSDVQDYRETYERYQQAKAAGNEGDARRLARELQSLSNNIEANGSQLVGVYTALENTTGVDTGANRATIQNTTANITAQQATITATEFEETRLVVRTDSRSGSFTDPFEISGRVSANGTGLSNATIILTAPRPVDVQTNASGYFSLQYRPTVLPVTSESLTVRYAPAPSSVYLGSTETLSISVTQVTASVALSEQPSNGSFGEPIRTAGTVQAGGQTVRGYPLRLRIGGLALAQLQTDGRGAFETTVSLPAAVASGRQPVTIESRRSALAVQVQPVQYGLTIAPTETTLSLETIQPSEGQITVRGRLQTADGKPVPAQSISIETTPGATRVIQTNQQGAFELRLAVPEAEREMVDVRARFDGSGTNLESTSAQTQLELTGAGRTADGGPGATKALPVDAVLGSLIGLLVVGAIFFAIRRRGNDGTSMATTSSSGSATAESDTAEKTAVLLRDASDQLEAGRPDTAVRLAFAALRTRVGQRSRIDGSATHWEVYHRALDSFSFNQTLFRSIVEQYEQATYGPAPIDQAQARRVLDQTRELLEAADQPE